MKSPRSKNARMRHSQFLSASKRTFAGEVISDTPGPGAYDSLASPRLHGYAPVRASRFHDETDTTPGPADYEVRHMKQKRNISNVIVLFFIVITTFSRYYSSWNIQFKIT